jgi:hypothetical protein
MSVTPNFTSFTDYYVISTLLSFILQHRKIAYNWVYMIATDVFYRSFFPNIGNGIGDSPHVTLPTVTGFLSHLPCPLPVRFNVVTVSEAQRVYLLFHNPSPHLSQFIVPGGSNNLITDIPVFKGKRQICCHVTEPFSSLAGIGYLRFCTP